MGTNYHSFDNNSRFRILTLKKLLCFWYNFCCPILIEVPVYFLYLLNFLCVRFLLIEKKVYRIERCVSQKVTEFCANLEN